MAKNLSKKNVRVLKCIVNYIDSHGYPPTLREIQTRCGFKYISSVQKQIAVLEKHGFIERFKKQSRSIRIVDLERAARHVNAA